MNNFKFVGLFERIRPALPTKEDEDDPRLNVSAPLGK